jgi:hypothetical protein
MKTIKQSEINRLCICNSDKLLDMKLVVNGVAHEWVGIGWVELDEPINDTMYEIVKG